ncbi:MAG: TolC family protein [Acidobacteria bacterium]|nr:TolC family protein [Acidobacteriota bacterium]
MNRLVTVAAIAIAFTALAPLGRAEESTPPAVDAADGLTLEEAVALALAENPRIRIASSGEAVAVARLRQAQSAWLPQIGISESFTRGDNPVYVFGTLLEQGTFGPDNFDPKFLNDPPELDNYRLSVSARLPIFDQLRRWSSISIAGVDVEQAKLQSEAARQMLRSYTIRAYYGVLIAEAREEVASDAVRAAESAVESIRSRYETGLVVQSDLLAAEVQLSNFREQLIAAQGDALIAHTSLANVVGVPSATPLRVTAKLTETAFPEAPYAELLATALGRRADVRIATLNRRQAALGSRMAKGQFLPRVDTFANWGKSGETIGEQNDDMVVGLSVSWNLLDPGRVHRMSEARAEELAAEAGADQVRNDAELDILAAHNRFMTAKQRLAVGESTQAQAAEAARIVRDRYDAGLTTITEVLRADTAAVAARLARLAASYDYTTGYAELLRATGQFDSIAPFVAGETR